MIIATFVDDNIVPDFPAEERVVAMGAEIFGLERSLPAIVGREY